MKPGSGQIQVIPNRARRMSPVIGSARAAAAYSSEFSRPVPTVGFISSKGAMSWLRRLAPTPNCLKGRVLRYEEPAGLTGVPLGTQICMKALSVPLGWPVLPSSCNRKHGRLKLSWPIQAGRNPGSGGLANSAPDPLARTLGSP